MTAVLTEYAEYDTFARAWHAEELADHEVTLREARERDLITEDDTRMVWQLLGELAEEEVLIRLPEWLADEKVGYIDGATPTTFVGRIDRETEKAIRVVDSASARPLLKLANRIHHFKQGIEREKGADEDRREWLEQRLTAKRREFENRDEIVGLSEEWLPKSQLRNVVRRCD